jgi:hypothetical protein
MEKFCFVLMPFSADFSADIYSIIRSAADHHGIRTLRADEIHRAGFVMDQIKEHIETAALVIADLTDRNANVFYETAIAHMIKAPHQVILIAQKDDDVPFDLRPMRYLRYSNTARGGQTLKDGLVDFIAQAISGNSGPSSESIEGRKERTRRIVADCDAILQTSEETMSSFTIRFAGGLSALSISSSEVYPPDSRDYGVLLQRERECMEELIRRGATFRAVLAPRVTQRLVGNKPSTDRFHLRFQRMISLLSGDPLALPVERVQIALIEPYYIYNATMFDSNLLYDGIKAGMGGGYDLTIRLTDKSQIAARVRAFDSLFQEASTYTVNLYGDNGRVSDLRSACVNGLKSLYADFCKIHGSFAV